jgi:hypothetical protein
MMSGSTTKYVSIAIFTVVLLTGAILVRDAVAGGGGITEPQVIELVASGCSTNDNDPATECRVFPLRDSDGKLSGDIARFRVDMTDGDGNPVGRSYAECTAAKKTGSICTLVLSLKDGPYTDVGTIVATGTGLPPSAVTGGSGAYLNVGGEITGEDQSDGFHLFVNLIP